MKHHITLDQLNELSDAGKKKLSDWWIPLDGDRIVNFSAYGQPFVFTNHWYQPYPNSPMWDLQVKEKRNFLLILPSVSQMIECLDQTLPSGHYHIQRNGERDGWRIYSDNMNFDFDEEGREELCDALWEVMKKLLESAN